jgi:Uma2 family endonuclease
MGQRMRREEFYLWAEAQSRGRFERVHGEVIAMSPERWEHALVKINVFKAIEKALAAAGSDCVTVPDGMTVEIDDDTDFEPDAAIHCGNPIPRKSLSIPNPVVVVEVISPSSARVDTRVKREMYFRVPSIQHYLIVRADRCEATHYTRGEDDQAVLVATLSEGHLALSPPGITVEVADFYA